MAENWTKGPWHVGTGDCADQVLCTPEDPDDDDLIVECGGNTDNARLIAAAPKLYEALEDAIASLEVQAATIRHQAKRSSNREAEIETAEEIERNCRGYRAALAKARGEG